MNNKQKMMILSAAAALFVSGCASTQTYTSNSSDPNSLAGVNGSSQSSSAGGYVSGDDAYWGQTNAAPRNLSRDQIMSSGVGGWSNSSLDDGRQQGIQMAAASLGSQAGFEARSREIRQSLVTRATEYDRAFDFSKLMLEPGFLPPVITEGRDAYNQESDNEARASDRVYRIERAARIVSAPPSWRTYLLADSSPPARPSSSTLPQNSAEKTLWDQWADRGWNEGARLADQNFEANLARLRQDFQGMLRFKMLYEQGLVSMPKLARASLGVTGGGDEMSVNDRIIRVTDKAALDANTRNWNTPRPRTSDVDR